MKKNLKMSSAAVVIGPLRVKKLTFFSSKTAQIQMRWLKILDPICKIF